MIRRSALALLLAGAAVALSVPPSTAQHAFDGNIVFDNLPTNCTSGGSATFDGCALLRTLFTHNDETNPLLTDPYNTTDPDWTPLPQSPADAFNDQVVNAVVHTDACFNCEEVPAWANLERVCYRGAVPPGRYGEDWTTGWTYYNYDGADRDDIDYGKPLVILQGDITQTTGLVKTNNYLLRGRVNVLPPATLAIQEGTVIFGEKATVGFLVIERGAKIQALGTRSEPILFTSDQIPGQMTPGDFGGVVINGRSIANCADCRNGGSCVSEGTEVEHCGNDDCDGSGVVRYVRIEYAGHEVSPNNELNAWTFNSCGINTSAEYLQAFRGSDDLFEWFGGCMTAKHLVGVGGWDDGLDWQMGFRGKIQFAVIQQWSDNSDKGIEADNNEFDYSAPCRSNPVLANVNVINTDRTGGTSTNGIHFRRGTDAQVYNSIVMGWPQTGLRVQHDETSARGAYPDPGVTCGVADVVPAAISADLVIRTFPNPVTQSAHFFFEIPAAGRTRLAVFDTAGRKVADLVDADLGPGSHQASWSLPADRAAGNYFYRMESAGRVATGRIVTVH